MARKFKNWDINYMACYREHKRKHGDNSASYWSFYKRVTELWWSMSGAIKTPNCWHGGNRSKKNYKKQWIESWTYMPYFRFMGLRKKWYTVARILKIPKTATKNDKLIEIWNNSKCSVDRWAFIARVNKGMLIKEALTRPKYNRKPLLT